MEKSCGVHSCTRVSGNILEGEWKNCRSQKIKEFVVRLCLLVISEAIVVVLPTKYEMNKDDTKTMPKLDGEIPTGKKVKLVSRDGILARKQYNQLFSDKWLVMKNTHTDNSIWAQWVICRNI